jgi:hypothetical protein
VSAIFTPGGGMKSIMFNRPKTWRRKTNRWPAITRLSFWTLIKPYGLSGGQLAIDVYEGSSETTMASRLQRLNGWRRLWLVGTAAVAVWFVVVWPLQLLRDWRVGRVHYNLAIGDDFNSGQCSTYQTAPFEKLREPDSLKDGGCWHIYTSRKYDSTNTVPYTLEVYTSHNSAEDRQQYLIGLGIGAAGTAIVSGLVYFLGWLVGWILTGFRQHGLR